MPIEETYFAEPGRAAGPELVSQVRRSMEDPCIQVVLAAVHGFLLILNAQRQVLAVNREVLEALHRDDPGCLVGLRPGEVFNCVHFTEGPEGCGTSRQCRTCGAVLAILASQSSNAPTTEECRMSTLENGKLVAREFRVYCTPLMVAGERLTAFVLHDISAEKRRQVLEQAFLHNVLNSLGGLAGWSELVSQLDPRTAVREVLALTESLKDEVYAHRTLLEAESGALVPNKQSVVADELLEQLWNLFGSHPLRNGRNLELAAPPEGARVFTDRSLLLRVLVHMVKNALEATPSGGTVRVSFESRDGRPGFVVHNPGVISPSVLPHIFERSFSTRTEPGRGIGTYCMKLYGERYLGGEVSFSSDESAGTSFSIFLPPPEGVPAAQAVESAEPCILLVEDEESVARLATLFLTRLGFQVVACRNGPEAERLFLASPDRFDLVVTDARMPGMSGMLLGRRLHEAKPDLPIFLCTGAADDEAVAEALRDGVFRGVIAKPFNLPTLAKTLQNVASGAGRPSPG